MRTLAESLYTANPSAYAQYLDEGETGVTQNNYFKIISDTYLGQLQTAQFQEDGATGKIWASLYQDDSNDGRSDAKVDNETGDDIPIDGITRKIASNANAEMPRSYNSYDGGLYNHYAAKAESAGYKATYSGNAQDSICPYGWKLPDPSGSKSTNNLVSYYGYTGVSGYGNDATVSALLKSSTSFSCPGVYNQGGIHESVGTEINLQLTHYISGYATNVTYLRTNGFLAPTGGRTKAHGASVRCVKK